MLHLTYYGQLIVSILMVTCNPESNKDVHTASYYITLITSYRLTLLQRACMQTYMVE